MLTINSFNTAYHYYQQEVLPFRIIQDQAVCSIRACAHPHRVIDSPLDVTEADCLWLLQQPEAQLEYSEFMGGNFHICRGLDDLKEIHGFDLEWSDRHGGRWPNVMDKPLGWDLCNYMEEADGEPQWAMFLQVWTNSGGPVYYVPKSLWVAARVEEHIAETHNTWSK